MADEVSAWLAAARVPPELAVVLVQAGFDRMWLLAAAPVGECIAAMRTACAAHCLHDGLEHWRGWDAYSGAEAELVRIRRAVEGDAILEGGWLDGSTISAASGIIRGRVAGLPGHDHTGVAQCLSHLLQPGVVMKLKAAMKTLQSLGAMGCEFPAVSVRMSMEDCLEALGLSQFASQFEQAGYDDVSLLYALATDQDELRETCRHIFMATASECYVSNTGAVICFPGHALKLAVLASLGQPRVQAPELSPEPATLGRPRTPPPRELPSTPHTGSSLWSRGGSSPMHELDHTLVSPIADSHGGAVPRHLQHQQSQPGQQMPLQQHPPLQQPWSGTHEPAVVPALQQHMVVEVSIGGTVFAAPRSTWRRFPGSLPASWVDPAWLASAPTDVAGRPFIDRSPRMFPLILEFLRAPTEPQDIVASDHAAFECEVAFYGLEGVVHGRDGLLVGPVGPSGWREVLLDTDAPFDVNAEYLMLVWADTWTDLPLPVQETGIAGFTSPVGNQPSHSLPSLTAFGKVREAWRRDKEIVKQLNEEPTTAGRVQLRMRWIAEMTAASEAAAKNKRVLAENPAAATMHCAQLRPTTVTADALLAPASYNPPPALSTNLEELMKKPQQHPGQVPGSAMRPIYLTHDIMQDRRKQYRPNPHPFCVFKETKGWIDGREIQRDANSDGRCTVQLSQSNPSGNSHCNSLGTHYNSLGITGTTSGDGWSPMVVRSILMRPLFHC